MSDDTDRDLQRRFQALKERDQREAPGFGSMWRLERPAASGRLWLASAAAVAMCAVLLVFTVLARRDADLAPRPRQVVVERAPLDFLLERGRSTTSLPLPAAVGRGFLE